MAHFLRDQILNNLTIDEEKIRQIGNLFIQRQNYFNNLNQDEDKKLILIYVIRFDGKGYRIYSLDELMQYFQQAKTLERIIFTLESVESLRTSRAVGTAMEIRLDKNTENGCFFIATADDRDWVDASFSSIYDLLVKTKNRNWMFKTAWTKLVLQILGVVLAFFVSLLTASKFSSYLAFENSFVICFFFALLIFLNIWSYVYTAILSFIDKIFPGLKFYRGVKDYVEWIVKPIITTTLVVFALGAVGIIYNYFLSIFKSFLK